MLLLLRIRGCCCGGQVIAVPTGIVMLLFFYACQCDNAYYDIEQSVLFAGRVCLSRRGHRFVEPATLYRLCIFGSFMLRVLVSFGAM